MIYIYIYIYIYKGQKPGALRSKHTTATQGISQVTLIDLHRRVALSRPLFRYNTRPGPVNDTLKGILEKLHDRTDPVSLQADGRESVEEIVARAKDVDENHHHLEEPGIGRFHHKERGKREANGTVNQQCGARKEEKTA
jgi:hypothetical protein